MPFFAAKRDEHDQADLAIKIERQACPQNAGKGREHAGRYRQQHRDRDYPALVERDQEQIGEQDCQAEDHAGLAACALFLEGRSAPLEGVPARQGLRRDLRHRGQRAARGHARCGTAIDGNRTIVVVARDNLRAGYGPDGGDRSQRHLVAVAVADLYFPKILDIAPIGHFALQVDLPGAAEQVEVVHVIAAERRLQAS